MADELLYYIDDYTDEWMPCAPTLGAWAAWLAKSAADAEKDWSGRGDIAHGAVFKTTVMRRVENITATKGADGWTWSREPEADATFFAWSTGRGWDAETATDTLKGFLECQDEFTDPAIGDELDIAVCCDMPSVQVTFEREPVVRCVVTGLVQ